MVRREIKEACLHIAGIIVAVFFMFPIVWQIMMSLKNYSQLVRMEWPSVFIFTPTLSNYETELFKSLYFMRNSLIVSSISTILCIAIGSMAGYALARFRWSWSESFAYLLLIMQIFPNVVLLIPVYTISLQLQMTDTYTPLILAYTLINSAFVTWLMRGIFEEIRPEYEEAAMLDGCSRLKAMWRIVLPLSLPGLIVAALFTFIFCWNEYLFALGLTSYNAKTMPPYIGGFVVKASRVKWEQITSISTIQIMPVIAVAILLRKYLIRGLTLGMVK